MTEAQSLSQEPKALEPRWPLVSLSLGETQVPLKNIKRHTQDKDRELRGTHVSLCGVMGERQDNVMAGQLALENRNPGFAILWLV